MSWSTESSAKQRLKKERRERKAERKAKAVKRQSSLAIETIVALAAIPFWIAGAIGKTAIESLMGDGLFNLGIPDYSATKPTTVAYSGGITPKKEKPPKTVYYTRPEKKLKPLRTEIVLKEKDGWSGVIYAATWGKA